MGFLEKTGKNVDEALEQALNELKTTRDKVNIEVIEEAKDRKSTRLNSSHNTISNDVIS